MDTGPEDMLAPFTVKLKTGEATELELAAFMAAMVQSESILELFNVN